MIPRWLISTFLAIFFWGIWAALGKVIGDALTGPESQALSTLGMIPVMLALFFWKRPALGPVEPRGLITGFFAGVLGCAGNVVFYEILKSGDKVATVAPLTALYPLVTVLLAAIFLREKLNRIQLAGVILSFAAMYLFNVQQDRGFLSRWLLIVMIPVLLWGLAGLLQKISTNHITGELSTLCFLVASVPAAILILVLDPISKSIEPKSWLWVILLGLSFALGNYAILDAFARGGKASIITPISGLYSLVSIPIAILFLGERIGLRESIAIVIALAAVAAISIESKAETPT